MLLRQVLQPRHDPRPRSKLVISAQTVHFQNILELNSARLDWFHWDHFYQEHKLLAPAQARTVGGSWTLLRQASSAGQVPWDYKELTSAPMAGHDHL